MNNEVAGLIARCDKKSLNYIEVVNNYGLLVSCLVVAIVVVLHYEFLYRFTQIVPKMKIRHHFRIVASAFSALVADTIEVYVFAVYYYYFNQSVASGYLGGNFGGSIADCIYYSFETFTILGFGDIEPFGSIRYLTGFESLTGLVLFTWMASFLYFEMHRYWNGK